MRRVLKNKPLVEAIFELRWDLYKRSPTGEKIDPYYKVVFGGIYNRLKSDYPLIEPLPAADVPERFSGYIVQTRLRGREKEWPLIQIGPGVITLNETSGYIWEDFRERALQLVEVLFDVYPEPENLKISKAILRYIDGIEFDYEQADIFGFLKKQMKTELGFFPKLFEDTGVGRIPEAFDTLFSFPSTTPNGVMILRIARGTRKKDDAKTDALIWEMIVDSSGENSPGDKERFPEWIDRAHDLTDDWFFKIIEGELERRFE